MEKTDVLVIGGSAAGIVAATTGKAFHRDKKVTLLRKEEKVLVPCGIPYIFGSLENSERNVVPERRWKKSQKEHRSYGCRGNHAPDVQYRC